MSDRSLSPESAPPTSHLKRKSTTSPSSADDYSPPTKKAKPTTINPPSIEDILKLTPSTLSSLPKATLISHIRTLQSSYALSSTNGSAGAKAPLSREELRQKVDKLADMIHKGIKKQMKWRVRGLGCLLAHSLRVTWMG